MKTSAEVTIRSMDPLESVEVARMWKLMAEEVDHPDLAYGTRSNQMNFFHSIVSALADKSKVVLVADGGKGKLFGFLFGSLDTMNFTGKVRLFCDSVYVRKEVRNGVAGHKLINTFELWGQAVTNNSVSAIEFGTPYDLDYIGKWATKDYKPIGLLFRKTIEQTKIKEETDERRIKQEQPKIRSEGVCKSTPGPEESAGESVTPGSEGSDRAVS